MIKGLKVKKFILSIDPGRKKCGIALVDYKLRYIAGEVVNNERLMDRVKNYLGKYQIKSIVVGSGTNSENIIAVIKKNFPELFITVITEEDTTRLARRYFFEHNPPTGWLKLIPISLRIPPRPYDDFAAYVIARKFFSDYQQDKKL